LSSAKKFKLVAFGGTFDHLHIGHRVALKKALEMGERVIIGITSDDMVKKTKPNENISPFELRKRKIELFLHQEKSYDRVEIIKLEDQYGPTTDNPEIDAIIASRETMPKIKELNKIRKSKGLPPLEVILVDTVLAEDGKPVSSTRIRRGEIDPHGHIINSTKRRIK